MQIPAPSSGVRLRVLPMGGGAEVGGPRGWGPGTRASSCSLQTKPEARGWMNTRLRRCWEGAEKGPRSAEHPPRARRLPTVSSPPVLRSLDLQPRCAAQGSRLVCPRAYCVSGAGANVDTRPPDPKAKHVRSQSDTYPHPGNRLLLPRRFGM